MPSSLAYWAITGTSLVVTSLVASSLVRPRRYLNEPSVLRRAIASPRETLLPHLTPAQVATLPYPPNLFPGARDVETPYGVMRVYEWGPQEGMKVILVHGDTTPGPMLGPIAEALVDRGCRVMIIDLWGRGYSDTPLDVPHDSRLFSMQLVLATASSPLSWTGSSSGGFSIVAFSLGGGITMSFVAHFYYLVNSIILLAPAGILRRMPDGYENILFRLSSVVPSTYLRRTVGELLGVNLSATSIAPEPYQVRDDTGPEIPRDKEAYGKETLDAGAIVQWQFDHNKGFVHSFINSARYGPIMHQESDWKKASDIIKGEDVTGTTTTSRRPSKLRNGKILVIFGDSDGIVAEKDVAEDIGQMLGTPEHVEFKTVPGSHGFPIPSCNEVVKHICSFWNI